MPAETTSPPVFLPLEQCEQRAICGGKAVGLGRLLRAGFRVPPGVCLTVASYRRAFRTAGIDVEQQWATARQPSVDTDRLACVRRTIASVALPAEVLAALPEELSRVTAAAAGQGLVADSWAVRSSATVDDREQATYGGLFQTLLDVPTGRLPVAIASCWSAAWSDAVLAYGEQVGDRHPPEIAVVLQPMLRPVAAGVAFSRHPMSGDPGQVVVDAVPGSAGPFVAGRVRPDEFVVTAGRILSVTPRPRSSAGPALIDREVLALAALVRQVEATLAHAVDVEWGLQDGFFWLLQARPISSPTPTLDDLAAADRRRCIWSRANFKETLPELPSPLALSFVRRFMAVNILARYRALGCRIPDDVASVRVYRGRPYLNLTLLQSVLAQLGGDPARVIEQIGGEAVPADLASGWPPRLSWPRLLRALLLLQVQIWAARWRAPARFQALSDLADEQSGPQLTALDERAILRRLDALNERLERGDLTFAIVSGVSQAFYVLSDTLARRLSHWRSTLNAATRGLGTIISAEQILWLRRLAEDARHDSGAREFFTAEPWEPHRWAERLAGTRVRVGFTRFLTEYGHRAVGESDIMSPRFSERPEPLLAIIRAHLQQPPDNPEAVRHEQAAGRRTALARIRTAFGWRRHEWLWFSAWYAMLGRYLALREGNRHALMRYLAAARRAVLILGRKLAARGALHGAEDIFFLTDQEIRSLVAALDTEHGSSPTSWKRLVAARRAERRRHETESVPQTVHETMSTRPSTPAADRLCGLPLSAGVARGPVRRLHLPDDMAQVRPGEVVVAAAIDPGMAPLFGLIAGLVVEMGGLLSHGAIVAREYGLPVVANIADALSILQDGELVVVDAERGEVIRLGQDAPVQSK